MALLARPLRRRRARSAILAGVDPRLAIAGALALGLLLITIANLTAGLVGFVALSFLELVPSLGGPTLSLSKVAGAMLALSWLAGISTNQYERLFPSVHPLLIVHDDRASSPGTCSRSSGRPSSGR